MAEVKLELSKEGQGKLDKIKKEIEADSREEVLREALSLYTWVVEKIKDGFQVAALREIENKPGELESVKPALPGLKKIKSKAA